MEEPHNRKKFSVVLFLDEKKFSVVPSNWLSDEGTCFWPGAKTKNRSALIEDHSSLPGAGWTKHSVEFKKSYGKSVNFG